MHRQHLSLNSPLARGAIAAGLLAALAGVFLFLRDDDAAACPTADVGAATATDADGDIGALDGREPIVGQPAPDFALRDLDGETVTLHEFRGRIVFLNFWATWCRPCKQELPAIQKVADEHPNDLVVLIINWRETAAEACGYLEENDLDLRSLLDSGGVYDQYRLNGLPDSFFIDREGNLAEFQIGQLSESKMRERLAEAGLEQVNAGE
jgi:thiol-disulfide isomerase/thioredoxin